MSDEYEQLCLDSIKVLKLNVNFVYDKIIEQFINNNGNCNEATFSLLNWSHLLDTNNNKGNI
jgi:hypothetical protein